MQTNRFAPFLCLLASAPAVALPLRDEPPRPDQANPLPEIAEQMEKARVHLESEDTGTDTQKIQQALLTRLDELIRQAEQARSSGSGKGDEPSKLRQDSPDGYPQSSEKREGQTPAQSSADTQRPKAPGLLIPAAGKAEDWLHLTPQEREAILQEVRENYPPEYADDIEEYFKKLAEGKR